MKDCLAAIFCLPTNTNALVQFIVPAEGGGRQNIATTLRSLKTFEAMFFYINIVLRIVVIQVSLSFNIKSISVYV